MKGVDVSSYQGYPDWKKAKACGIEFAMLRCHQRYGPDASFEHNYKGCQENGIATGVYKYSYAKNVAEARAEAEAVLDVLKGKALQLPVYYDLEDDSQTLLAKEQIEEIALAFLSTVSSAGFPVGIYCNKYWYLNKLSDKLKSYDLWIATIPSKDTGEIVESLRPAYAKMWQYSWKGKVDGIAGDVDMDTMEGETMVTAETILNIMRSWIGLSRSAGTHKVIIDTYNAHTPRARGYYVGYSDAYCDTTISAAFIKAGATDLIGGTECGVEEHVKLFMKAGIWIEDGTIVPQAGDIIVFNWDDSTQPNDGYSDHIGIVESVSGNTITTIEGNMSGGVVGRRSIPVGYGYIRGYARPRYQTASVPKVEVPFVRELHPVETKKGSMSVTYMKKGCTGTMVKVLQTILNDVADAGLPVTGEYDAATVKALKAWQKAVGVTASGKTGVVTWRQLALKANEMTFKA